MHIVNGYSDQRDRGEIAIPDWNNDLFFDLKGLLEASVELRLKWGPIKLKF